MPGERTPDTSPTKKNGSTDDDISLREHMQRQIDDRIKGEHAYFERVIVDLRSLLDERFRAQQNAVDELKTTTTQRFESVNEFRAQLNEQASKFMGRDESISRHERTSEMIQLMSSRHENEIRLLRERIESDVKSLRDRHEADMSTVNSRLDVTAGQSKGADKVWGFIVAGAGLLATIVGLIAYAVGNG